jgi:hypothetical protein
MPLMTQGAASSCGIFPQRWESIVGEILGQIASSPPVTISSLVVSSFSSGISYSSAFRSGAKLGNKLRGIIDFDGIISSYKAQSLALPPRAVRIWQGGAQGDSIPFLAGQNISPAHLARWQGGGPYKGRSLTTLQIHSLIPQMMMAVASRRAITN